MSQSYLATIQPGLEEALLQEIRGFKTKRATAITGGVEFEATRRGFYQTLLWSRLANRLYWRFADFRARDRRDIFRHADNLPWEEVLPPGATVRLKAVNTKSRLGGTGEIEDAIKDALAHRIEALLELEPFRFVTASQASASKEPVTTLLVRCQESRCTISFEAGGRALHRRGWRAKAGSAPMRETMAAALLQVAAWDPATEVLFDPTCGAGTIAIEAARLCAGLPPRTWPTPQYGVSHWRSFDPQVWQAQLKAPKPVACAGIVASDLDASVMKLASKNASHAKVSDRITFLEPQDVAVVDPPDAKAGLILSNPPYGERLAREEVYLNVMRRFSTPAYDAWRVGVLLPRDFAIPEALQKRRTWVEAATWRNGGLPVRLWLGTT